MEVRPIDRESLLRELTCDFTGTPFHGNRKVTIGEVRRIIESMPTLTQPNEPLACEGCIYEHNEHENCNYCKRAPYLGDYYYRRPPEGEEETE